MRINALYVAIVLFLVGIVPKWWAYADVGDDDRIEVGLRGFVETSRYEQEQGRLRDLNGMGNGFETRGFACFVLGIAAIAACGIASELVRRERWLAARLLALPLLAMAIATCVFASSLAGMKYLDLGRSIWLCLLACVLGIAAVMAPRSSREI